MNYRKQITRIIACLTLGFTFSVAAQQDVQYTQYMYNTQTVNPAYVGSRGTLNINGIYRSQWVGLDGAPKTAQVGIHTPIGERGVGLGITFRNEEIGPAIENNLAIDYSYAIDVSYEAKLSFGLKTGFQLLDVDFSQLNIENPNEVAFQNNIDNRFTPVIGAGVYLYSDRWYVGLSTPNFLDTNHYDNSQTSTASERAHYFLTAGYVFDLSDDIQFKPALLARAVSGAPLGLDISANFWFNQKLTVGAAYRLDAAFSGLVGFQASDSIMIGYAYDADTTDLGQYNNGSHEVFLRFEIFGNRRNLISPRFF